MPVLFAASGRVLHGCSLPGGAGASPLSELWYYPGACVAGADFEQVADINCERLLSPGLNWLGPSQECVRASHKCADRVPITLYFIVDTPSVPAMLPCLAHDAGMARNVDPATGLMAQAVQNRPARGGFPDGLRQLGCRISSLYFQTVLTAGVLSTPSVETQVARMSKGRDALRSLPLRVTERASDARRGVRLVFLTSSERKFAFRSVEQLAIRRAN